MSELHELEQEKNDQAQQGVAVSAGGVLQAARIARNLTLQDVSGSLRYSVRQIEALESNAFDMLPEAMITRGFIRNYARLLEIDAEPLLVSYSQSVTAEAGKKGIVVKSSMRPIPLTKESQPWFKYILASILVLLFLLAWIFYTDYMPKSSNPEVADASVTTEEAAPLPAEPLPEIALPAAQRQAEASVATAGIPASSAPAAHVAEPVTLSRVEVKSPAAAPESLKPAVTQAQQPRVVAVANSDKPGNKALTMSFTDQTWVSVADKGGKVIYEKTLHSGDKETISVTPPLNIVIGNASAAKLSFGGKDIDVAAHSKSNVARIALE